VTAIVVMGVSGSGKSTVGGLVAGRLGLLFLDGDHFHDAATIAAMTAGDALDDEQRQPWLRRLNRELQTHPEGVVLACSALKRAYRDTLRDGLDDIAFVHLAVGEEALARRLAARTGHFAGPTLLSSQLTTLELGDDVVVVDGERTPDAVATEVVRAVSSTRDPDARPRRQ
jgi:carbohydrate kinase (thermoresistant glucokinase family)